MYTVNLSDCSGNFSSFKNVWAVQIEENYICLVFSGYDMLFEKSSQFAIFYDEGAITIIGINLKSL